MFDIEKYYEAKSIEEAIKILNEDEKAFIISGGTDVLIKLREGKNIGSSLVSIRDIPDLIGVEEDKEGNIFIKSATTFHDVTSNILVNKRFDFLSQACDEVGGPQIRNIATIGGNICNGACSADSACSLLVLNAKAVLKGKNGLREISLVNDFYTGPGKTVRDRTEICLGFKIDRKEYEGYKGYYIKYGKRKAMEIATLGCCVMIKLDNDNKTIEDLKIAYSVAAPTPIRCKSAESFAKAKNILDENFIKEFCDKVLEDCNPRDSWRASKDFRMHIIKELAKSAIKKSYEKVIGKYKREVSVTY